jgi:hypothetical protein
MEKSYAEINLNEEETCVDCKIGLGYPKGKSIETRPCYTEGSGDRCYTCQRIVQLTSEIAQKTEELERLEALREKQKPS